MRLFFTSMTIAILLASGAGASNAGIASSELRAYITFGNDIVLMPDRLRLGDRIIVSNVLGMKVLDQRVTNQSTGQINLRLPSGMYTLRVERGGNFIKTASIPVTNF